VLALLTFSLSAATLLDDLDGETHKHYTPLEGAKEFQAVCVFLENNSEDHFEEAESFPFGQGMCTMGKSTVQHRLIFVAFEQTATFEHGEEITVQLIEANVTLASGIPSWAQGHDHYLIQEVLSPATAVTNYKARNRIRRVTNLVYDNTISRSILMLRVIYSDASAAALTMQQIYDNFAEVETTLSVASYGALSFHTKDIFDVDMGLISDGTIIGCDWSANLAPETDRIIAKASEQGIDTTTYDHVEMWLPTEAGCTWGGLGSVSGRYTWEQMGWTEPSSHVRVHELGHNFGLHHAATVSGADLSTTVEYGDATDDMGCGSLVGFALPAARTLGFVPDSSICTWSSFASGNSGTQTAVVNIASHSTDPSTLASGECAGISLGNGNTNDYTDLYVSFRSASGLDANLGSVFTGKVSIHFGESSGYGHLTYLVETLEVGEAFPIPMTFSGTSLSWDSGSSASQLLVAFCAPSMSNSDVAKVALVWASETDDPTAAALTACESACTDDCSFPAPSPPPTNMYSDSSCEFWQSKGFCEHTHVGFMWTNCAATCALHSSPSSPPFRPRRLSLRHRPLSRRRLPCRRRRCRRRPEVESARSTWSTTTNGCREAKFTRTAPVACRIAPQTRRASACSSTPPRRTSATKSRRSRRSPARPSRPTRPTPWRARGASS